MIPVCIFDFKRIQKLMSRQIIFLLCLCAFEVVGSKRSFAQSASKLTLQDIRAISTEMAFEGTLKQATRWNEKEAVHVIITSETGSYENKAFEHPNEGVDAQLFAYHYVVEANQVNLLWKVTDYIKDCPVDIEARFIDNTLQVTDLNANGVKEIWLMYVTVCHGDVSPLDMKIIMYEGAQKYAMRGQNRIKYSPKDFAGGDYKFDKAFNEGNALFRSFAKKLWQQHIKGN